MFGAVTIRAAQLGDSQAVLVMLARLAAHEGAPQPPRLDTAALQAYVFDPSPRAYVCVAERGNALIGFVLYFETFSSWAGGPALHIGDLWVEPAARGLDVGRRLLEHALNAFPDRRTDVYVVRSNNARTFYERCGFREEGDWVVYRREHGMVAGDDRST